MKRLILFASLIICVVASTGLTPVKENENILGSWVRLGDRLRIEVKEQTGGEAQSFIVMEGKEKFPCDVSDLAIYKNITKAGRNLWRCQFLVVTMGSCSTDYEDGIIRLTEDKKMEIVCPGYANKVYERINPRYESE